METTLTAELRADTGKGAARRLRATGLVPGILYGHGMDPVKLSISGKDLLHLFHTAGGGGTLVDLKVDGKTHLAIPRTVAHGSLRFPVKAPDTRRDPAAIHSPSRGRRGRSRNRGM